MQAVNNNIKILIFKFKNPQKHSLQPSNNNLTEKRNMQICFLPISLLDLLKINLGTEVFVFNEAVIKEFSTKKNNAQSRRIVISHD